MFGFGKRIASLESRCAVMASDLRAMANVVDALTDDKVKMQRVIDHLCQTSNWMGKQLSAPKPAATPFNRDATQGHKLACGYVDRLATKAIGAQIVVPLSAGIPSSKLSSAAVNRHGSGWMRLRTQANGDVCLTKIASATRKRKA